MLVPVTYQTACLPACLRIPTSLSVAAHISRQLTEAAVCKKASHPTICRTSEKKSELERGQGRAGHNKVISSCFC